MKHPVSQKTALHLANDIECTKLLLEDCVVSADWKAKDREGNTPLHYRAQENNAAVAELLLNSGAKYTRLVQNIRGQSPQDLAQSSVKALFQKDRQLRASKYSPSVSQVELSKADILADIQQAITAVHSGQAMTSATIRGAEAEGREDFRTAKLTMLIEVTESRHGDVTSLLISKVEAERNSCSARKAYHAATEALTKHRLMSTNRGKILITKRKKLNKLVDAELERQMY